MLKSSILSDYVAGKWQVGFFCYQKSVTSSIQFFTTANKIIWDVHLLSIDLVKEL